MIRSAPLRRTSKGLCATKRQQRRAYERADAESDPWCVACGTSEGVEHSHLFSQGRFQQHRNNPLNWLRKCRRCHDLFEHDKAGFAARHPDVWAEILRRMPLIDEAAFAEFQMKNPTLFT